MRLRVKELASQWRSSLSEALRQKPFGQIDLVVGGAPKNVGVPGLRVDAVKIRGLDFQAAGGLLLAKLRSSGVPDRLPFHFR